MSIQAGFGKTDITPRLGVEMSGFGPFIHRYAESILDRLYARAMAVRQGDHTVVIVSCDLIEVESDVTEQVRQMVFDAVGIPPAGVMLHNTHTHSAPAICPSLMGWGEIDQPYAQLLPQRIAAVCIEAVQSLAPATIGHAEVSCEGMSYNREYDSESGNAPNVLEDTWRPAMPELTDTTCHVLTIRRGDEVAGFCAYFSCHPVVCCALTRKIHGDYCGVAMRILEQEYAGATGLFLQGALGDVNSAVVHQPEAESLHALEVLGARFAGSVRAGIAAAKPIDIDTIRCVLMEKTFTRQPLPLEKLEADHAKHLAVLRDANANDDDRDVRMSTIMAARFGELVAQTRSGEDMSPSTQLQGIRLGPVSLLATPFEVFQAIKRDILADATAPIPLVMSVTNDAAGYAPDRTTAANGENYTAWVIPIVFGTLPYKNIHDELREAVLELDAALNDTY